MEGNERKQRREPQYLRVGLYAPEDGDRPRLDIARPHEFAEVMREWNQLVQAMRLWFSSEEYDLVVFLGDDERPAWILAMAGRSIVFAAGLLHPSVPLPGTTLLAVNFSGMDYRWSAKGKCSLHCHGLLRRLMMETALVKIGMTMGTSGCHQIVRMLESTGVITPDLSVDPEDAQGYVHLA